MPAGRLRSRSPSGRALGVAAGLAFLNDRSRGEKRQGPYLRADVTQNTERATIGAAFERTFVPSFGFGGSSQSQQVRGFVRMPLDRNRMYVRGVRVLAPDESVPGQRVAARTRPRSARPLGYSATRHLRVEGVYAPTPPGHAGRRRQGQPVAGRRPDRRLPTHEDPVMEERAFHPLDYLTVVSRRKWWLIVPVVLGRNRRHHPRADVAQEVHLAGENRHRRPDAFARTAARRQFAGQGGAAARDFAAAPQPAGARAGGARGEAGPEQAGRRTLPDGCAAGWSSRSTSPSAAWRTRTVWTASTSATSTPSRTRPSESRTGSRMCSSRRTRKPAPTARRTRRKCWDSSCRPASNG